MSKIVTFVREVRAELEKVTWPKKDELVGAVIVVCFLAIIFAALIGAMDSVISVFVRWVIR